MMHECAANGCKKIIASGAFMCRHHLDRLPQGFMHLLHKAWFEKRRNITGAAQRYSELKAEAIAIVAESDPKVRATA